MQYSLRYINAVYTVCRISIFNISLLYNSNDSMQYSITAKTRRNITNNTNTGKQFVCERVNGGP